MISYIKTTLILYLNECGSVSFDCAMETLVDLDPCVDMSKAASDVYKLFVSITSPVVGIRLSNLVVSKVSFHSYMRLVVYLVSCTVEELPCVCSSVALEGPGIKHGSITHEV